ncbi:MAG: AAA domain-containing protein [Bacteroidaceae bacterium]
MIIDRQKHIQFLKDEYRAESEVFKKKFLTQALCLLKETEEIYVGKFLAFREGEMVMKFPNTRNLPRKGEHLFCMLLPNDLQNYNNWGTKTYKELYDERHKATDAVCIWHSPTDDTRFSLVGFRKIDLAFADIIEDLHENILVFAPQKPPLDYISNLTKIVEDSYNPEVSAVLDADYQKHDWQPALIKQDSVTEFVHTQLFLSNTMILQGPPGTGKTYMIAELCSKLCLEGKSVLVTALTNRALMEIAEKPFLKDMLNQGKVHKTNMTVDERRAISNLQPLKQLAPMPSCLVLSTYYITSGYAAELSSNQPFDVVIMDEASQALLAMFGASKKLGMQNLWVGDVKQLSPIVTLNEDRVAASNYRTMIDGLNLLTVSSTNPVYQLTDTYRFGKRAAQYTNAFYNGTLVSKLKSNSPEIPNVLCKVLSREGGPSLVLTDMAPSDYTPDFAAKLVTYIVGSLIKDTPEKEIAVLTCMIKTTKYLQRAINQSVGSKKNILIETIARVQGLTTDTTILVIPSISYIHSLNPMLFNVATSRAREHTIIIADKDILKYSSMDTNVRDFLTCLSDDLMVYIPSKIQTESNAITEDTSFLL